MAWPKGKTRVAWNKGLNCDDLRVKRNTDSLRANPNITGKAKTPELEEIRRAKISSSGKGKIGGYRENAGRSKKFKVYDSFGKLTTLQSTFEYALFEILCELEIRWIRPKALKYNGKNYFADFYLVDFNLWLDPKNDFKAKCDAMKIKDVTEQNNIRLYILLEEQINKSTVISLIF